MVAIGRKTKRERDGTMLSSKLSESRNKANGRRDEGRSMKLKEGGFVAISSDYQDPKSHPSRHH